ncbi:MAG: O-antigen ligase family protein, partial [Rikenellaceae bacterium]
DNSLRLSKKRFFLVVSVLTSVSVILATASRGAIISVGLAMIAFLILRKMTIGRKIAFMLLISGMIYLFYTTVESSEWVALRMQQLFEEGDQSRISIYQDISHFAFDSPIFGLGETGYYNKMVQYRGSFKASHNGFLDVYLYTGIVGCICFLTFLSYLIQFCWRLHKRQNISIATTLFIIIIFNFAKSGSGWNTKIMWVVFSIIVGMYYIYNTKRKNMVKKPLNIKQ